METTFSTIVCDLRSAIGDPRSSAIVCDHMETRLNTLKYIPHARRTNIHNPKGQNTKDANERAFSSLQLETLSLLLFMDGKDGNGRFLKNLA